MLNMSYIGYSITIKKNVAVDESGLTKSFTNGSFYVYIFSDAMDVFE